MKLSGRHSISTLLLLTALVAIPFAYINHRRSTGSDRFQELIEETGGWNLGGHFLHLHYSQERWAHLFGDSRLVYRLVHFDRGKIDTATGYEFSRNRAAAKRVEKVCFYQTQIDEHCPYFIWDSVTEVVFEDITSIPDSWMTAIATSTTLKSISFCGAETDISLDEALRLTNLEFLGLSNLGIYGQNLSQLRNALPNTKIRVSAHWGEAWPFEPNQTLSNHNSRSFESIEEIFEEFEAELAKLNLPVASGFNPPASVAEIAKLEQFLGTDIPSDLRALFEIHNGQRVMPPLLKSGRFLSIDEICKRCETPYAGLLGESFDESSQQFKPSKVYFIQGNDRESLGWGFDLDSGEFIAPDDQLNVKSIPELLRRLTKNLRKKSYRIDGEWVTIDLNEN